MRVLLPLALLLSGLVAAPPAGAQGADPLRELRRLYLASVGDERAIRRAEAEVERIRRADDAPPALAATLTAYRGALETLRAKHALLPPSKLRHLGQGLATLDGVVAAHPEHVEARYLRLMSCFYLPGILGRKGSVREDFATLARRLPGERERYPPELYDAIARFVLEEGAPTAEQRQALRDSLERGDG